MASSSSDTSSTLSSSADEDSAYANSVLVVGTHVFESNARVLPPNTCLDHHGKGKRRLSLSKDPDDPAEHECGHYYDCDEGIIYPASLRTENFRMSTDNPVQDLKRWISMPNQCIAHGPRLPRSQDCLYFMHKPRFTADHIRECSKWANELIKQTHRKIRVELKYLHSPPYHWRFYEDPIGNAMPLSALPTDHIMDRMDRPHLANMLMKMAVELDYLKEREEFVRNQIIKVKWDLAKRGDWGEIAELLQHGCIEEEDVRRECQV